MALRAARPVLMRRDCFPMRLYSHTIHLAVRTARLRVAETLTKPLAAAAQARTSTARTACTHSRAASARARSRCCPPTPPTATTTWRCVRAGRAGRGQGAGYRVRGIHLHTLHRTRCVLRCDSCRACKWLAPVAGSGRHGAGQPAGLGREVQARAAAGPEHANPVMHRSPAPAWQNVLACLSLAL